MREYYLWLTPDGDVYDRLSQLISQLSQECLGVSFEPHITLLGELDGTESLLVERGNLLAEKLGPISIDLQEPAFEDAYSRCLYFNVRKSGEILDAREQAKAIFGKMHASPFHPHISVLYGLFPSRIKEDITAAFPSDLPKSFLATEMKLIRAESISPQDWHLVETIRLEGAED